MNKQTITENEENIETQENDVLEPSENSLAAIQGAEDRSFSKFSDAVSKEMKQRMANHPDIVKYQDEFQKLQKMKDIFAQISTVRDNSKTEQEWGDCVNGL